MKINDYILEERKFLHEISNYIVVLEGMLGSAIVRLESSTEHGQEVEKLKKSLNAATKLRESAIERKNLVSKIQESIVDYS